MVLIPASSVWTLRSRFGASLLLRPLRMRSRKERGSFTAFSPILIGRVVKPFSSVHFKSARGSYERPDRATLCCLIERRVLLEFFFVRTRTNSLHPRILESLRRKGEGVEGTFPSCSEINISTLWSDLSHLGVAHYLTRTLGREVLGVSSQLSVDLP